MYARGGGQPSPLFVFPKKTFFPMTNRKKRQLSVLTAPNPVGQEPANERIFTPIHRGRADKERLVDEIMALHPGLERETIRMVIDLENRVVLDLLLEGVRVNNGLFEAHVACRGTVEGGIWQEGHNQEYTLTLRTFYSKSARVLKTAREVSVDLMILPYQPE